MRLDQFVQYACFLSRSKARKLIKQKKLSVNNIIVSSDKHHIDPAKDQITFKDQLLVLPKLRYYLLHKPGNIVCSHKDDAYPSVFRLINDPNPYDLHVAGRLDADTTGLVLLTDDGAWLHKVTHPNKACAKQYRVTLSTPMSDTSIDQLRVGVLLKGESTKTLPTIVEQIDKRIINLTIYEGRYHQVKRMMAAVGNQVVQLHREQMGALTLAGIAVGEYRPLTDDEIKGFL